MAVPQKPNVQNLIIGLGVILIIIAGFVYFRSRGSTQQPSPSPEEVIVQEEGTVKKTGETTQPLTPEEIQQLQEEVNSVLSTSGQSTQLTDVSGGSASGEAKRAFSDGKFYFKISTNNLSSLEKGFYYEGWLENDGNYLSTGRVELTNGSGSLYYTSSVDRSDYPVVLVSRETEGSQLSPTEIILRGEF